MKLVSGGKYPTCDFTVHSPTGDIHYSGLCSSTDVNECGQYAQQQASTLNAAAGYPGVSWSCSDNPA